MLRSDGFLKISQIEANPMGTTPNVQRLTLSTGY